MNEIAIRIVAVLLTSLVIAFSAFLFIDYKITQDKLSTSFIATQNRIVDGVGVYLDDFINNNIRQVKIAADTIASEFGEVDNKEIVKVLKAFAKQGDYLEVYYGMEDGGFVSSAGVIPAPTKDSSYDPRKSLWYTGGKIKVGYSEPYRTRLNGESVVTFYAPIIKADKFIGVAGVDVRLDSVIKAMNKMGAGENSYSFISQKDSTMLMHPDAKNQGEHLPVMHTIMDKLDSGDIEKDGSVAYEYAGEVKEAVCRFVGDHGWLLCSSLKKSDKDAAISAPISTNTMIVVSFLILFIFVVFVFLFRLVLFRKSRGKI
ncbi:cache domain-containing protein [Campylobacter sp. 19-13652]|uniref:cache domain-containing protein n=1 Tax=Campylobacter sp. 19-13652 TaxID=2840180 RepID=UPI001C752FE9|nr:cache domain-containing protein [Campylobacter sp. 19-13652]BCX79628.1 hypothetical protein LBC_10900 [Campylobacter sp. 19-13652]